MLVSFPHLLLFLFSWTWGILAATPSHEEIVGDFFTKNGAHGGGTSNHTNNWAVLVCSSRYWFNYRVNQAPFRLVHPSEAYVAYGKRPGDVRCKTNVLGQILSGLEVPHGKAARHPRLEYNPYVGRRRGVQCPQ